MHCRVLLLLAIYAPSSLAAPKDVTKYPLRVTILDVKDNVEGHVTGFSSLEGTGHGNVIDGDNMQGITFHYNCGLHLMATTPPGAYAARWKKPGARIELLGEKVGAAKETDCELKVALHQGVLEKINGNIVEVSQADYRHRLELFKRMDELTHPSDTDLAHFPLRFMLLESNWSPNQYIGGVTGSGRGNLVLETASGPNLRAVDFIAVCPMKLTNTVAQGAYPARWLQEPSKLLVMARGIDGGVISQCDLKTTLSADRVYVQTNYGNLAVVSQSDYAKLAARPVTVSPTSLHPQVKQLLNNGDIATLNSMGMSSKVILAKIAESDCAFDTSPRALEMLKKASVPDEVLVEMIKCGGRPH